MSLSRLSRGPRGWPEHPLEAGGIGSPQVRLCLGNLAGSSLAAWGRRDPRRVLERRVRP
jgi:hypothetical protein